MPVKPCLGEVSPAIFKLSMQSTGISASDLVVSAQNQNLNSLPKSLLAAFQLQTSREILRPTEGLRMTDFKKRARDDRLWGEAAVPVAPTARSRPSAAIAPHLPSIPASA